jgi:hypothetical protein
MPGRRRGQRSRDRVPPCRRALHRHGRDGAVRLHRLGGTGLRDRAVGVSGLEVRACRTVIVNGLRGALPLARAHAQFFPASSRNPASSCNGPSARQHRQSSPARLAGGNHALGNEARQTALADREVARDSNRRQRKRFEFDDGDWSGHAWPLDREALDVAPACPAPPDQRSGFHPKGSRTPG